MTARRHTRALIAAKARISSIRPSPAKETRSLPPRRDGSRLQLRDDVGVRSRSESDDHPGIDTAEYYVGDAVWSDGPYEITSYTPDRGGSLILDRNPNWIPASDSYRGAYPDKWEVDFGLDPEKIDQRLMQSTGNDAFAIDYSGIQADNLAAVFADPHTVLPAFANRAFGGADQTTSFFWIDPQKVPNREIRAAMAASLDREAIRQNRGGDFAGDFADGAVNPSIGVDYAPTGLWDSLLSQPIPASGDPDYAKTLIAQTGEPAPLLTWSYFSSSSSDADAAIVKESLEKAGFRVDVKPFHYSDSTVFNYVLGDFGPPLFYPQFLRSDYPNASTVIPAVYSAKASYDQPNVDDTSGIPDWTERVQDAETTLDRSAQAVKWQNLNKDASEQVWIIPLLFGLSQHIGGTNVGNLYRWAPYASWPYAQLYVRSSSGASAVSRLHHRCLGGGAGVRHRHDSCTEPDAGERSRRAGNADCCSQLDIEPNRNSYAQLGITIPNATCDREQADSPGGRLH